MIISDAVKIIKTPLVRNLLDEVIDFPSLENAKVKLIEIDRDQSALFAFTVEILLDFYFKRHFLLDDHFVHYIQPLNAFVAKCERDHKVGKGQLFVIDNMNRYAFNASPDYQFAVSFSQDLEVVRLSELERQYLSALETIVEGINYDRLSNACCESIILVAKVQPTLRKSFISLKQYNRRSDNLIEMVRLAHENVTQIFPERFIHLIHEPKVRFKHISCRPDFIADDRLIEIKCTADLLAKDHLRQVVFYYLACEFQKQKENYSIKHFQVYYPLYNLNYQAPVEELLKLDRLESTLKALDKVIQF